MGGERRRSAPFLRALEADVVENVDDFMRSREEKDQLPPELAGPIRSSATR
ncbi:MAG: hypothetical protein U0441_18915 [Polyangiaceae bacterium]